MVPEAILCATAIACMPASHPAALLLPVPSPEHPGWYVASVGNDSALWRPRVGDTVSVLHGNWPVQHVPVRRGQREHITRCIAPRPDQPKVRRVREEGKQGC